MDKKKTTRSYGSRIALGFILLAALVGGLTVLRFAYRMPSTTDARLLFNGKVLATMNPGAAAKVQEGMAAIVTIEGFEPQKFAGVVQVIEPENDKETLLMIKLKNPPDDVHPPVPCTVTVDVSTGAAPKR